MSDAAAPPALRLWIDADACPRIVKDVVFKAALRLQIPTTLVANQPIGFPRSTLVSRVTVGKEIDAADLHIAAQAQPGDIVVTADIPLAAKLVAQGVVAIDPRGTIYSAANVQEALATRNLMHELREGGMADGTGPAPLGPKDRERFANALDRELTRLRQRTATTRRN